MRCLNPFRWIEIGAGGEVTPCCAPWFKGSLGSIRTQSLAEIWNGPRWRELREAMVEGGNWAKFCNARTCPHIQNDVWAHVDFLEPGARDVAPITEEVLDAAREGATEMNVGPAQIGFACDSRCNLRCIMCHSRQEGSPPADPALLKAALGQITPFLPDVRRIKMMGDGEPFAITEARDFLFHFDAARYPQAKFLINTNGTLLTPELWPKLEHLRIDWLCVSIDAATGATYEKIRRGGAWDVLMRNLDCMVERYRAGRIGELMLSMCVMKSNHREVLDFAALGRRLGVSVFFMPILGGFGEEQIFDRRDALALRRLAAQLRDPRMHEPGIDTSGLVAWRDWRPGLADYGRTLAYALKRRLHPLRRLRPF